LKYNIDLKTNYFGQGDGG
jgi:hypothetical protein